MIRLKAYSTAYRFAAFLAPLPVISGHSGSGVAGLDADTHLRDTDGAAVAGKVARTVRECAACAHVAQALPGAPRVCLVAGAVRRVEINRAEKGLCGVLGRLWSKVEENSCSPRWISFLGGNAFRLIFGEVAFLNKKQEHALEIERLTLQGRPTPSSTRATSSRSKCRPTLASRRSRCRATPISRASTPVLGRRPSPTSDDRLASNGWITGTAASGHCSRRSPSLSCSSKSCVTASSSPNGTANSSARSSASPLTAASRRGK